MPDKARSSKRRKAKGRGGGPKEAIFLIPLTYNDGTRIPQDTIESIYDELFVAFAGWTVEGTVQGAYRMQTGEKRVESLVKVSVILDESQLPELEEMIARWAARLGQETILLKIADYIVKFVPPEKPKADSP
jgi:hypothetical protein